MSSVVAPQLQDIELGLLLEGISHHYGCDLRNYVRSSLKRRVMAQVRAEGVQTVSGYQEMVLHDPTAMARMLFAISTSAGGMFQDPDFYLALRREVLPILRTYPFVRIWHAGCSSGEEVYSMAILLREEGLYPRARIYATEMNETVLAMAKAGSYPLALVRRYEKSYIGSGGRRALADYYKVERDTATFLSSLRENIVFAQHNLATDRSFNEFNLILCRNVMIAFSKDLQHQVHGLLRESLCRLGILGLGARESLRWSGYDDCYEELEGRRDARLYRRIR